MNLNVDRSVEVPSAKGPSKIPSPSAIDLEEAGPSRLAGSRMRQPIYSDDDDDDDPKIARLGMTGPAKLLNKPAKKKIELKAAVKEIRAEAVDDIVGNVVGQLSSQKSSLSLDSSQKSGTRPAQTSFPSALVKVPSDRWKKKTFSKADLIHALSSSPLSGGSGGRKPDPKRAKPGSPSEVEVAKPAAGFSFIDSEYDKLFGLPVVDDALAKVLRQVLIMKLQGNGVSFHILCVRLTI